MDTYKYAAGSPVFHFKEIIARTKQDMYTVAATPEKAAVNIAFKLKKALGYVPATQIYINIQKLEKFIRNKPNENTTE